MTSLWILACFFCYCAGSLAERTNTLVGHWRAIKKIRPLTSQARYNAATTAITGFALFLLACIAALGFAFFAWWFQ